MKTTIFAKNRKTSEGRAFVSYVCKLTNTKTGEEISASVRFKEPCPAPKASECPLVVEIQKSDANLSRRSYVDPETGIERFSYTLWVENYIGTGEKFVDHSLDDFE